MKITANGGTCDALMVLFWPEQLPVDADPLLVGDPTELIAWFHSEGKLIWLPCNIDGTYSLAIFVNSDVPANLLSHCRDEGTSPCLTVSGPGYFCGGEYVGKLACKRFSKSRHLSVPLDIPAGTYTAQIYRTQLPISLHHNWIVEHAGPRAGWLNLLHGIFTLLSLIGVIKHEKLSVKSTPITSCN